MSYALASLHWMTEQVVQEWETGCPNNKSKPKQKRTKSEPNFVAPVWTVSSGPKGVIFWIPEQPKNRYGTTVYKSVFVGPYLYSPCQCMNADKAFQYLSEKKRRPTQITHFMKDSEKRAFWPSAEIDTTY